VVSARPRGPDTPHRQSRSAAPETFDFLAAALGFALVENGWRVLFTRTTDLVQRLQIARRELAVLAVSVAARDGIAVQDVDRADAKASSRTGPQPETCRPGASKGRSGNDEGRITMTSRVPLVSLEHARELGEAMGLPARRTQSEAFRVLANNPGVARVAYSQLIQLLENNKLDTRLRELMIMRIGWVTGSAYEWTQHWRVATTAGIPPEDILAVRDWRNSERLTPADKAILAATDECLVGKSISDASWAEVVKHVTDPGQQVEFIIAMGNWMMFSLLFRNLRIPLAEGLMVWPPDGLTSPAAQG
jgi:alkylhydroperoxidase family enzyme